MATVDVEMEGSYPHISWPNGQATKGRGREMDDSIRLIAKEARGTIPVGHRHSIVDSVDRVEK